MLQIHNQYFPSHIIRFKTVNITVIILAQLKILVFKFYINCSLLFKLHIYSFLVCPFLIVILFCDP